ncbi:MAG: Septum formation initiator [candidate division TM6 bacterium GW2011_GWF2_37_49]|nr:MAG: Septum formation initiator [candidate division TM6 bacterium GW2011_GWF2_37_49]
MTKNALHFSLLIAVLAACLYFIIFGQRGVMKYYQVSKEIQHEKAKLAKLEQKNKKLQAKIEAWQNDNFQKEKFARQDLQMSKPDEMVFVLTQT